MKKIISIAILAVVLFSGISLVQAKPDQSKQSGNVDPEYAIPEQNGIYDVPGHPELKVKVFVHRVKPDKPGKPTPPPPQEVCGLDDDESEAIVDSAGWRLPSSWTYKLNPASVPSSVDSGNLGAIAEQAFGVWSEASGVAFSTFATTTETRARYDRQNIIAWGRTSGTALAVTYTWYYPDTGMVAEVDTIMNQKFPWSWTDQSVSPNCADANSYDAQNILTHELGHWMGLDDHYTNDYIDNTMYGYGSKEEMKKDTLTAGDITGIVNIYGSH